MLLHSFLSILLKADGVDAALYSDGTEVIIGAGKSASRYGYSAFRPRDSHGYFFVCVKQDFSSVGDFEQRSAVKLYERCVSYRFGQDVESAADSLDEGRLFFFHSFSFGVRIFYGDTV